VAQSLFVDVDEVLVARGLQKAFRGVPAVDGVDLTIRSSERVALLGPNGAGKTTTLLMILGVVSPDTGTVTICGHLLPRWRSEAMRHVGFAAGYLPLPERLRVGEVLGVFAELYGIRQPKRTVDAGLARFGISHLTNRMASELSSGQRTLVGIVKATVHRPRLLILDEPTASLDPDVAERVRSGLETICSEDGTTVLVTSHNMTDVERVCERVVFLSRGRIVADGKAADVATAFGQSSLGEVFMHLASQEEL
jgi:ABC-2 type transport system ATP-binding protein